MLFWWCSHAMRTKTELKHIQEALFHLRKAQGRYLADSTYSELTRKETAELMAEARQLHFNTELRLRRVMVNRKWEWRFTNKNGL